MTDRLDPYAELGIPRTASQADVKRAYRRKAKKAHPDGGGNADEFTRLGRALAVLDDPERRKKFDETGHADEGRPDNKRAAAIQLIDRFIADAINVFIQTGLVHDDPRRRDLLAEFREVTNSEISNADVNRARGKKALAFVKDIRRRFLGDDPARPIERGLDHRIADIEAQLAGISEAMEIRNIALGIAGKYRYEQDPSTSTFKGGYVFIDRIG